MNNKKNQLGLIVYEYITVKDFNRGTIKTQPVYDGDNIEKLLDINILINHARKNNPGCEIIERDLKCMPVEMFTHLITRTLTPPDDDFIIDIKDTEGNIIKRYFIYVLLN